MKNTWRNGLRGKPLRWISGILVGGVALYFLLGYFAVDPLAKRLLPWVGENKLASRLHADRVNFDPLRLSLEVDNLRLARMNDEALASLGKLQIDLEADGLFRRAWHLHDIRLTAPAVHFKLDGDGKLNWSDLIAKLNEDKKPDDDRIPRVVIDHILIERGSLHYADHHRPEPFSTEFTPLALELDGFSTLPQDRGDYLIAARMPDQGAIWRWKGNFGANPLSSAGSVEIRGIHLPKLAQAIRKGILPVTVTEGELGATLHYDFAMVTVPNQPEPKPQAVLSRVSLIAAHLAAELDSNTRVQLAEVSAQLPTLDLALHQDGQVHLQGLDVKANDIELLRDSQHLLKVTEAEIDGVAFDTAQQRMDIARVLLKKGDLRATRGKDGVLDWQTLGPAASASPPSPPSESEATQPFRFAIGQLQLQQWSAGYEDRTFVHPLKLGIDQLDLGLALQDTGEGLVIETLEAGLGRLTMYSALSSSPVARLADIRLAEGAISVKDRAIHLPKLTLSGLQTEVVMDARKTLNWITLLESVPLPASAAPTESPSKAAPWTVSLGTLRLENAGIRLQDSSSGTPVALDMQKGMIELRDASLDLAKPVPIKAAFSLKQGGRFDAEGKLALAPLKGDLNLKLDGLPLAPFSPYLNQHALLQLADGQAGARGKLTLKPAKVLSARFNGSFAVKNLAIHEEIDHRPFLSWKSVSSNSLQLGLAPDRLQMDELRIEHPVGRIIIFEDKTMNIQRMLRPAKATPPTSAPPPSNAQNTGFPVEVNRVSIEEGDLEFADLSLVPQFGTQVHTLSGVINGLSTDPASAAQVELDGKVDDYGSARVRGTLQPFRATENTDLKVAFRNLEMNRLTPYSGKFAGRKIDSGKMSVDLEYKIKHRQLSGENKFVINTLKLGERVDSPDAVDLPLDLAIALLEDSQGVIDLDLPISGSLDDPQFSYGKIVWKAIVNVLGKIVTAPFRALGKLLGISSDKLEAVAFDPGESALLPPEQEKLKVLADAMAKRPALALRITPAYDATTDKAALQEEAVRRAVLQEMGVALRAGERPGPVDLNNIKVQTAVENLHKDLQGQARSLKAVDAVRDYFRKPKPEDVQRYEAMLKDLKNAAKVSDDALESLAKKRADAIRGYLVDKSGLPPARVTLAEPDKVAAGKNAVPLKLELGVARKGD